MVGEPGTAHETEADGGVKSAAAGTSAVGWYLPLMAAGRKPTAAGRAARAPVTTKGVQAVVGSKTKTNIVCLLAWFALGSTALAEDVAAPASAEAKPAEGESSGEAAASAAAEEDESEAMRPAKNGLFLEGLGPGILYSVNYERLVIDDMAVRIGFSYWSVSAGVSSGTSSVEASASFFTVPVTVTYVGLTGLEVGGGLTLLHASGAASTVGASASGSGFAPLGTALLGYRSHPVGGAGFQFRVGAMAMMGEGLSLSSDNLGGFGVLPWLYLSAGAGF